jgi:hypothetical protein
MKPSIEKQAAERAVRKRLKWVAVYRVWRDDQDRKRVTSASDIPER